MTGSRASAGPRRVFLLPLLASFGFHGALLCIPMALQVPLPEAEKAPFIELSLGRTAEPGDAAGRPAGSAPAPWTRTAEAALPPAPAQPAALPTAALQAAARDTDRRPADHRAAAQKNPAVVQRAPSPADVLEDAQALTGARGASDPAAAASARAEGPRRVEQDMGWEGPGRTLLRRVDPEFPPRLAVSGVEADCEARIAVSPGGNVVRVEITRGSGYIEIDRNVEAALRQFLFSRVDPGPDAQGTVRFRFRLGRRE